MALGIGANVAMFSVLNAAMLRPLPYRDPDRVVLIWETKKLLKSDRITVAAANYQDWRNENHVFDSMALVKGAAFHLIRSGEASNVQGLAVTADYFRLLGASPRLGRTFTPEEEKDGSNRVLVLSYKLWQSEFGADPKIVGRHVALDDGAYTVIGVMPANFYFPEFGRSWDLWIPAALSPAERTSRDAHVGGGVARLRSGVTLQQAQDEMDRIAARLEQEFPASNTGAGVRLVPIAEQVSGPIRQTVIAMFGVVGMVLLIACCNIANLSLVRSAMRQKDIAIRIALGASRSDLVLELLTESSLLPVLGGAVGVLGASILLPILKQIPVNIPRIDQVSLDTRVLLFATLVTLASGVLFGLAPVIQFARKDIAAALCGTSKGSASAWSPRGFFALHALVVSEIGLAFILLVSAGLLMASLRRVLSIDPGFRPESVLTARISLPETRYRPEPRLELQARLLGAVRRLPEVSAAGLTTNIPIGGQSWSTYFYIEGRPLLVGEALASEQRVVSSGYFEAMGIPLLAGRVFQDDDAATHPSVAVINDVLAKRFFPGENPLGHRVKWGRPDDRDHPGWFTIVGIVGSVRDRTMESPASPELYMCSQQMEAGTFLAPSDFALVVRSDGSIRPLISAVRSIISGFDSQVPITDVRTMEQVVSRSLAPREFILALFGGFAGLALVFAWVGTYGIVAYSTALRTHELGIRIALGSDRRRILRLVISQGMRLAGAGIALGLASSWVLTRSMSSLLYGISPYSSGALLAAALTLSTAAFFASYFPACRAASIDPSAALRSE
jgi:putative ABC transport system permease protein